MEKKQIDWKFVIGTILLAAVLIFMILSFWKVVAKQAALVKEEEAREEAEAISAVYVYREEGLLKQGIFVNRETMEIFDAEVPKEGIYNKAGTLIAGDILEEGDYVKIYGDGVMSEDVPMVYEGVTKMQRTGRATLEEAEIYRQAVAEAFENE